MWSCYLNENSNSEEMPPCYFMELKKVTKDKKHITNEGDQIFQSIPVGHEMRFMKWDFPRQFDAWICYFLSLELLEIQWE